MINNKLILTSMLILGLLGSYNPTQAKRSCDELKKFLKEKEIKSDEEYSLKGSSQDIGVGAIYSPFNLGKGWPIIYIPYQKTDPQSPLEDEFEIKSIQLSYKVKLNLELGTEYVTIDNECYIKVYEYIKVK